MDDALKIITIFDSLKQLGIAAPATDAAFRRNAPLNVPAWKRRAGSNAWRIAGTLQPIILRSLPEYVVNKPHPINELKVYHAEKSNAKFNPKCLRFWYI